MKYRVGQWVGWQSIDRERDIIGKVVEAPAAGEVIVVVETRDGCSNGETRRVTFHEDAPWFPSRIRWIRMGNNRRGWKYA